MAFPISPGTNVSEIDLTTGIEAPSTSGAALAGFFKWGPVNKIINVSSEPVLLKKVQSPDSNTATFFFSAANFLAYGNNLNIVRANSAGLYTATANATAVATMIPNDDYYFINNYNGNSNLYGPWAARNPGVLGNTIVVYTCPSKNAFSQNITSSFAVTANANVGNTQVILSAATANSNIAVGDLVYVGNSTISNGWVSVTGVNGSLVTLAKGPLSVSNTGGTHFAALPIQKKWKYADQFQSAPNTSSFAASVGGSYDELHIVVVDANGAFTTASTNNYMLEKHSFISKASNAIKEDGSKNYYKDVLYNISNYIFWMDHISTGTNWGTDATGTSFASPNVAYVHTLTGGADGEAYQVSQGATPSNSAEGNLQDAWDLFANKETIKVSMLITGPASEITQQYVFDNIATIRKDCIEYISPRYGDVVNQSGNEATNITLNWNNSLARDGDRLFADSAWKYQFDKYNGVYRYIPLNADIAGLKAQTNNSRDVWVSPAGFNRGGIKNIVKLSWNPNQASRDILYKAGFNPVVTFPGQGTILFGDKTKLSKPSAFDRIGVRSLFDFLEEEIEQASRYSLFEINDDFSRAQFINTIEPGLRDAKGRRGIYDYLIVCDETNNTPDIIDQEQFVGDIYIKPSRSINFIQLNFVAVSTGVNFTEIIGRVG